MPKLPVLTGKEMVRVLLALGFVVHHQTGGHIQLRHVVNQKLRVTVPRHDKFDLPAYVVASILRQAEISREDFLRSYKRKQ